MEIIAVIDKNGERQEVSENDRVVLIDKEDRIVRKASIEAFVGNTNRVNRAKTKKLSLKEKTMWKSEHYVVVDIDELNGLMECGILDNNLRGFVLSLMPYILFEKCSICYSNGRPLNVKKMADVAGVNYKTAYKYVKALCDYRLLAKHEGIYYINPWLVHRGTIIDSFLYELFKHYYVRSRGGIWSVIIKRNAYK